MAYIYQLAVECGQDQHAAEQITARFKGLELLAGGERYRCDSNHPGEDHDGNFLAVVSLSDSQGRYHFSPVDEVVVDRELRTQLFEVLRELPCHFRFAFACLDADSFRTYSSLDDEDVRWSFGGLVLSTELWERFRRPPHYEPFNAGHVWKPLSGSEQVQLVLRGPLTRAAKAEIVCELMRDGHGWTACALYDSGAPLAASPAVELKVPLPQLCELARQVEKTSIVALAGGGWAAAAPVNPLAYFRDIDQSQCHITDEERAAALAWQNAGPSRQDGMLLVTRRGGPPFSIYRNSLRECSHLLVPLFSGI